MEVTTWMMIRAGSRHTCDINNNRIVSISDVGILMQYWDQTVTDPSEIWKRKADINGDWWVDVLDVGILMENWQKTI